MQPTVYAKAVIGALVAGLGSLAQALDNDAVTAQEWVNVAITTLVGLGIVYAIPNTDPHGRHQRDSVQPPVRDDRGAGETELILRVMALVIVAIVVVWLLRALL